MKPFRATYTQQSYVDGKANRVQAETVSVIAVLVPNWELVPIAIFIDDENRLRSDTINHFTNCQSSEWRE
jgi:hypothetical protein